MEQSDQDPSVWVLRSPRQDWAYKTARRIHQMACIAEDLSGSDEDDYDNESERTVDSDEEEEKDYFDDFDEEDLFDADGGIPYGE